MVVEDRLVAILGKDGNPVGAGLIIDDDLVLTCAHVVNTALGHDKYRKARPDEGVEVRVHGSPGKVNAAIDSASDAWSPPPPSTKGGDLCVLRLPPKTYVGKGLVKLREYAQPQNEAFRAVGYPADWKKGEDKENTDGARGYIVSRAADGLYLLRSEADSLPERRFFSEDKRPAGVIYEGFSGAPVESRGAVVGLLTMARTPEDRTAYMIPASWFPKRFREGMERYDNPVFEAHKHVEKLCTWAKARLPGEAAQFDVRVRLCDNFEEVLNVHRTSELPASDAYDETRDLTARLFARALHRKTATLLLHAPGGGGKSSFLLDLLLTAPSESLVPFLIDFSSPTGVGKAEGGLPTDQLRQWFARFKGFGSAQKLLDLAQTGSADGSELLLVIDGVNQGHVNVADVLATVATLSNQELATVRIIVSDRMVDRRSQKTAGFTHAVVPPLARAAYEKALAGRPEAPMAKERAWRPILSSPMFLDLMLRQPCTETSAGAGVPSRFQILSSYYRDNFDLGQLRELADFAYRTYGSYKKTTIPKTPSEKGAPAFEALSTGLRTALEKTDLVQAVGGHHVEFRHQLFHDSLAALKVASAMEAESEALLRGPSFDVISIDAASADAIELAVEAVQRPEDLLNRREPPLEPREILSEVFDWNYRITLHCVASFDRRGDSPLPHWVRHAVYAHNLERLYDPFLHTVVGAERMKSLIPLSPDVEPYLGAASAGDIVKSVAGIIHSLGESKPAEETYRLRWLDVCSRERPFLAEELWPIWQDAFLGWMTANAIRRFENPPEVTRTLLQLYQSSRATSGHPNLAARPAAYRWRLVHALGRGTPAALDTLLNATLDRDESADVRYGSVRSLVELAVTRASSDQRREMLDRLRDGFPRLLEGEGAARIRRELRRTCAFNETRVEGRVGWLQDWLTDGLPQFIALLRAGELALANSAEAGSWTAWRTAAERVLLMEEWTKREFVWRQVIATEL
jgi:hypothetical protein